MGDINVTFSKKGLNTEEQIVYGEVYAPGILDAHGDVMPAKDIKKMAHDFMQLSYAQNAIDTNHDQQSNGAYPVESFIAREGDPDYTPGAWVLGVKIADSQLWEMVKKGDLNGYSFQARVYKRPKYVEIEVESDNFLRTEEAAGHTHFAYIELDENGRVLGGMTSLDYGHKHNITAGTATEKADGHAHRIFIDD